MLLQQPNLLSDLGIWTDSLRDGNNPAPTDTSATNNEDATIHLHMIVLLPV